MDKIPFNFSSTDYLLAPHTRYRIGGPAKIALFPQTLADLEAALCWLDAQNMPFIVIGGGTNMLIDDRGYPGCALFTTSMKTLEPLGQNTYRVGAGVVLGDLVRQIMLPNNYQGIGALTGIPGTVGGALFMNAGTANGSICQLVSTVTVVKKDGMKTVPMTEELYGYRGQTFCERSDIIAEASFAFVASERNETEVYEHYMQRRRETQPEGWCCGSVFKNPPGDHAGRLIEAAGLKGTRHNGAVISDKHANFIMNEDGASFEDVLYLITLVKDTIRERFGVELHEEVRIIRPPE